MPPTGDVVWQVDIRKHTAEPDARANDPAWHVGCGAAFGAKQGRGSSLTLAENFVISVADRIRTFDPAAGVWRPLDSLFTEAFAGTPTREEVDAVFSLFERFPEDDGAGVFWSAIHGLEAVADYEDRLRCSLRSAPSESAVILAIRIVNAGDPSFLPLIAEVASRHDAPASVRSTAAGFIAKKQNG